MRHLAKTALVAAALSFPVAANADTFLAGSYNVINGQAIVADLNGQIINGLAGQVQLVGSGPNAGTDWLLWCIGITTNLFTPYNYTVTDLPIGGNANGFPGVPTLDATQVRQIASLAFLGNNGAGIDKAGIAVAIWKAEYGNALSFIGLTPTLQADSNAYLALTVLGALDDCTNCSLKLFTDIPTVPDQPFATANIAAVPIPAVGTGLPGIILGFGALYRWRKKKWLAKQATA